MSQRVLLATFRREKDLLGAVRAVRSRDAIIVDVYSPYAVHGLDEALGWGPSRLTWACGLSGAAGALFMLWFQFWTSAVNWPLNIGGKPFNSLPAFVPVIFEAMVLCGAVGTVLAFLYVARLRPGKRARLIRRDVTDDRFALIMEQTDATFDVPRMTALLQDYQAEEIEERVIDRRGAARQESAAVRPVLRWVNSVLAFVLVVIILTILIAPRNLRRPNLEFLPTMRRSIPLNPQTALPGLKVESPLPGTVARNSSRTLDYQATEADARRAGEELTAPFAPDDEKAIERGRFIFVNFCTSCHGPEGDGDGPMIIRGYPPPPPWGGEPSRLRKDGELFHIISYGRNNMPAHRKLLSQADRWRAVSYVRALQRRAVQRAAQATAATSTADKQTETKVLQNSTPEPGANQP